MILNFLILSLRCLSVHEMKGKSFQNQRSWLEQIMTTPNYTDQQI